MSSVVRLAPRSGDRIHAGWPECLAVGHACVVPAPSPHALSLPCSGSGLAASARLLAGLGRILQGEGGEATPVCTASGSGRWLAGAPAGYGDGGQIPL